MAATSAFDAENCWLTGLHTQLTRLAGLLAQHHGAYFLGHTRANHCKTRVEIKLGLCHDFQASSLKTWPSVGLTRGCEPVELGI